MGQGNSNEYPQYVFLLGEEILMSTHKKATMYVFMEK